jgi:outer membrane protein TolC
MRPQSDLAPARSDELHASLETERARGQRERSRRALELSVGGKLPEDGAPDRGLLELSSAAGNDDPEGRALELSLRATKASAEAHEHAHGPVLAGNARAGAQAQNDSVFPTYGAAITLQVPLWDGGGDHAAADAARARAEAIAAEQREHAAARSHAAAEAQHEAEHARRLLDTAESLLASCKNQLGEAEARVELQGGSLEPVASARAMVRKAESEVVLAKIAVAQALLSVAP